MTILLSVWAISVGTCQLVYSLTSLVGEAVCHGMSQYTLRYIAKLSAAVCHRYDIMKVYTCMNYLFVKSMEHFLGDEIIIIFLGLVCVCVLLGGSAIAASIYIPVHTNQNY